MFALLSALFGPRVKKAAHGVKELCRALLDEGIEPEGFVFDTELAAYLLDPTAGSYELRKLVVSYFKKEVEQSAAYKDETAFSLLDDGLKAQTAWYEDTAWIEVFYELFKPKLEEFGLLSVLTDIELPLCPVLARMERAGVLVDAQALSGLIDGLCDMSNIVNARPKAEAQAAESGGSIDGKNA